VIYRASVKVQSVSGYVEEIIGVKDNCYVKKQISKCQNKGYKGMEIKTIILENNAANLRLFEAFFVPLRNYNFALNSREVCGKFAHFVTECMELPGRGYRIVEVSELC